MALKRDNLPLVGDEITVEGEKAVVQRASRGETGITLQVTIVDDEASRPVDLPQPVWPPALNPSEEEMKIHEENRKQDEREQREINEKGLKDRERYAAKERELSDRAASNSDEGDDYDAGVNSHTVSAEAQRKTEEESTKGSHAPANKPSAAKSSPLKKDNEVK